MTPNHKVVLAFSGGLDTSFCVKYLALKKGMEVHTVFVNTGGHSSTQLDEIEDKAYELGAASHQTIDAQKTFYEQGIRYLIYGNVLRGNCYPLSVSAERVFQAIEVVKHAQLLGAEAVAHGSTGAGNDQIRFDLVFQILAPEMDILTPIRTLGLSRAEEVDFLAKCGVEIDEKQAAYSVNKGLWGTSVGGVETLTSQLGLPEEAWPSQLKKTAEEQVTLTFEKGELVAINQQSFDHPVEAIEHLQALAEPFAIGRDIHVGDTIIGLKGRVGFEAAAPLIIIKAHHVLEKHTLTKMQLQWKEQVAQQYGALLHEGQFLEPAMRDVEAMLKSSQKRVSGTATVSLKPYHFQVSGIDSPYDLMAASGGHYGEATGNWTEQDVKGFTKLIAQPLHWYHGLSAPQNVTV
jgi:argininosuccinate synthase